MTKQGAITLFLAAGMLIIGIHQTLVFSFAEAYWIIMLSLVLFLISRYLHYRKKPVDRSAGGNKKIRNTSSR